MKPSLLIILFCVLIPTICGQCKLKTEKDQFDGTITRRSLIDLVIPTLLDGTFKMKFVQFITPNDTTLTFYVIMQASSMRCFGADSKILIKAGENVLTYNLSGKIDCASNGGIISDYFVPSEDDIDFLKTTQVNAIRLYFSEGYSDFSLKKKPDFFIKTLKCFEN